MNRRYDYSDVIAVVVCIAIAVMSIISYLFTNRFGYEVCTGVFCAVVCLAPTILKRYSLLRLPPVFVSVIMLAIFLHAYGVLLLSYDLIKYYDTMTHFISSVVVSMCVFYTLMCYQVYSRGVVSFTGAKMSLMIALIMLGFSAYWEVFEYIVDITTGTTMQYSPFDTLRDMLCNTSGTIIVSVCAGIYTRKNPLDKLVSSFELHPRLQRFIEDPFGDKDKQ
ncbi:MAG: hypothetical protein ACI38Y_01620 [Candidatus Methanomethylophilaceae archaeon]